METSLSLDKFRSVFRAGGLLSISLRASGFQFLVTAKTRLGEPVILATTQGKKPRTFRNPAKALEILHGMGAHQVEVDTSAWSPAQPDAAAVKRPDTAERQRRAHAAAGHDAWFRREVEVALQEADGPLSEWDSESEVKRQSARKRHGWLASAKAANKVTV